MTGLAWAALLLGALVAITAIGWLGLRALYRWKRIYYSPADAPRLTPAGLRFLRDVVEAGGRGEILALSARLGWTQRPGARSRDGRVEIGPRGERVGPAPGQGASFEVACYGDCLVLGASLPAVDAWPARLQALAPALRVRNFGVEGYGLGQSWQRYEETVEGGASPDVALLGLATSNVFKVLNAFRPFYAYDHGLQLGKPRFRLDTGRLEVVPNPLPDLAAYRALLADPHRTLLRLARQDAYQRGGYRRHALDAWPPARFARVLHSEMRKALAVRDLRGALREGAEAVEVSVAILRSFAERAQARGTHPVVVLLPVAAELGRFRRSGRRPWDAIRAPLDASGIEVVDALDTLAALPPPHFEGRHYAAEAQHALAAHLAARVPAWRAAQLSGEPGSISARSAASSAR